MKKLKNLIYNISIIEIIGNRNIYLNGLSENSNYIKSGMLFAAINGINYDGYFFIEKAIYKGATTILCNRKPIYINKKITYIIVHNVIKTLGLISANYYDNPTKNIKLIGITGTDGKTTVATILYDLFTKLGEKVALISTIVIKILKKKFYNNYTTPNIITINKYLKKAIDNKCTYAFIEISSHSIHQKRIYGLNFVGGILTNITHEHIDYHKTFYNYISIKKKFFESLSKDAYALINADDKNSHFFLKNKNCIATKISYSIKNNNSHYKAKILNKNFLYTDILINKIKIQIPLIGKHNVYNILAAYSMTDILLNISKYRNIYSIIRKINQIKGRFIQFFSHKGSKIIIDYAHTPNALKNILYSIKELKKNNEKIICVIGCGGDRDISKRKLMAIISCKLSDKVIFTSDNPRNENPEKIINDMENGLNITYKNKIIKIINRYNAIKTAILKSSKNDIVLIAGKGHENFQEIKGVNKKFNDEKVAKKIIDRDIINN